MASKTSYVGDTGTFDDGNFTDADLTGDLTGASFSNQMVNLASSQILGLMTDARFLNMLCESPLSDMAVNGGFDSDTAGWTANRCTFASIAGGVTGNCLEVTRTEVDTSFFGQSAGYSMIAGKSYTITGYVKSGSSGNEAWRVAFYTGTGASPGAAVISSAVSGTSSAAWVKFSGTVTAPTTGTFVFLMYKNTTTVGTMLFDTVVITPTLADISMKAHDGQYMGTWASADRINKGSGWALDPNGTDAYIDLGDSNDFSFGDGSNDSPFTVFGLIEIVDIGAYQLMSKTVNTTGSEQREYDIYIFNKIIYLRLHDNSVVVTSAVNITNALSNGWHTFVATYSGVGGATAGNGVSFYIDGVEVAVTVINSGSYVAMENLTASVFIGARTSSSGTPEQFIKYDMAHIGLDAVEWSAEDVWKHELICRGLYNL